MNNENLLDLKYLNRDGDAMRGPLILSGEPVLGAHAATKRYIDTVIANLRTQVVRRDGTLGMTGLLTLSGAPTDNLHATPKNYVDAAVAGVVAGYATTIYVDAQDAIERAYADARDLLLLPLAGGTLTGVLTLAGAPVNPLEAATKDYVDTLPTGLNTYDAVVAAVGGDYTSIVTACATEAAGARIFVKAGTYNETANIVLQDGQILEGENPEDTIIDFGAANRKITNPGGCTNQAVRDLTIQGSQADYVVELQGDNARVDNCRIVGSASSYQGVYLDGNYGIISRTHFEGLWRAGAYFAAKVLQYGMVMDCTFVSCKSGIYLNDNCLASGNTTLTTGTTEIRIGSYCTVFGNTFAGEKVIQVSGSRSRIIGNEISGNGVVFDAGEDDMLIANNFFNDAPLTASDSGANMGNVTGNTFLAGTITIGGIGWTISGNTFVNAAGISLAATSSGCAITGNAMSGSTRTPHITDLGVANVAKNNSGVPPTSEKFFLRMKNTSGGALLAGDTVVLKAVAVGDEFTTTVNQGDDMVLGMLDEAIGNNAYGQVQVEGKTVRFKVNGVINISIGDLLGAFTVAGISMQAQAGDMAFAVALEAYAGADSNGVIDALLVTPRKV